MTILVTDAVDEQCIAVLEGEGFAVDYAPGISASEIKKRIATADALIVRSQTKVTSDLLDFAGMLKAVGRAGAGVDNIDVSAATRRGIIVLNTPGGNTISTAEHTFSLMLSLARNIPQANQSLRGENWERKKYTGVEIFEKTLGVMGLGKVGSELATRALSFGMVVVAYDPLLTSEKCLQRGIQLVELDELFERSDFISLHTPLTPETKGIINTKNLQKCKKGVRIINCARGGIVNEKDLLAALEEGRVAGAALDVFENEPPGDFSLIRHPHVVATPHLGASTEEAQEKVALQISHQIADFLKERGITGAVNGDLIRYAFRKEYRPYFELAERMGNFLAQLKLGELKSVILTVNGSYLKETSQSLGAALLKGLLTPLFEPVNYLNATTMAKERGISMQVREAEEHGHYTNMLAVQYETTREHRTFAGTVFGSSDVRLVGIDEFHFEIRPEGNLVLYSNVDRPGMLAKVSSVLANARINIGGLSLGRYKGGKALTIISLDEMPPKETIDEIARLEGVSDLRTVIL